MKKILALLIAFMLVFSLVACGEQKKAQEKKDEPKAEEKKEEEKKDEPKSEEKKDDKKVISVGLVTDTGGIDDKSFNQSTWEGVIKFYEENGQDPKTAQYLQSNAEADYIPNLSNFADETVDLIVAPGFKFIAAMGEVAANYPEQKFLLIDAVLDKPNVVSAVFSEHEGSYLVGVAAALKTKEAGKNMVGFMGGEDFDLINKFEAGFEQGVKAVDPEMKVVVEYAASFGDIAKGQTLAAKMFDAGCYVIYHAAGGTGNGLIKETMDRVKNGADVWACGVDKDQYTDGIYADNKSVVLTSMVKRVDTAAYDVATTVKEGTFKGGSVLEFNLKNAGVSLPKENPNLKPEWTAKVDEFAAKIKSGEITVDPVPTRKK